MATMTRNQNTDAALTELELLGKIDPSDPLALLEIQRILIQAATYAALAQVEATEKLTRAIVSATSRLPISKL